jgi:hypothetical protein
LPLERYKSYCGLNTLKMHMSGNRQQRQWLILAARELELMPRRGPGSVRCPTTTGWTSLRWMSTRACVEESCRPPD